MEGLGSGGPGFRGATNPISIMFSLVLAEFSCMFSDEKCSLEDFALWIESVMDSCFKVCVGSMLF